MQGTGLVLLTAGLVLGTSGVAGAKTVSDKKYAKSICGAITGVSNTIDQIQPANSGDLATAQAHLLATTGDPFSKLSSNQGLLQALKKEKTCAKIVTVYGG